jgi:diketogulonate reductase-like aldo/keto reductase
MRAAFKEAKVKRADVFVGTKLWNNNHRPERVRPAFDASLKRLQLDYVDLYSIHTPFAFKPGDEQDPRDKNGNVIYDDATTLTTTWKALESLVDEGRCKAIGLPNVSLERLKQVFDSARVKPAVIQIESHPYLPEWDLLDYCKRNRIVMQAFAALGHGIEPRLIDDPVITGIAKRVHKTPAQILLAWALQRGTAPLTTATSIRHIEENFDVAVLPDDAIEEITQGIGTRVRLNSVVATGIPGFIPKGR